MKDEEIKFEEIEASHTLGGAGRCYAAVSSGHWVTVQTVTHLSCTLCSGLETTLFNVVSIFFKKNVILLGPSSIQE